MSDPLPGSPQPCERHQAVVRVMKSATPEELMASVKNEYFDHHKEMKEKDIETFNAYHKLLTESKEKGKQKAVYAKVAGNNGVTDKDIEQCLREICRIIKHHAAILRINQAISNQKVDPKDLMAALQNPGAELKFPSGGTDAEPSREYQILLWEAYTEKAGSEAMDKGEIQKVLSSRDVLKKIDMLKREEKDKLLKYLRKDEMNLSEYLVGDKSSLESCASLIFEKRDEKKETTEENSCKFLTQREIKNIMKEFKAVWEIQKGATQELKKNWRQVLKDGNFLPDVTKSQEEADFNKLEGYRKLFKEQVAHQKKQRQEQKGRAPGKARCGFKKLLRGQDVQSVMFVLYPAIIKINTEIESFIKHPSDDQEEKFKEAISTNEAQLVTGTIGDPHCRQLQWFSEKRKGKKSGQVDETDLCFEERLTWKDMQVILSDLVDLHSFVEVIMSGDKTDHGCSEHYKNLQCNDKKDIMKYYQYKEKVFEELWGHTILHLALCFDRTKLFRAILVDDPELIKFDKSSDEKSKDQQPSLFYVAVARGNNEIVNFLLNNMSADNTGGKLNETVSKETVGQVPFHTAVLCSLKNKKFKNMIKRIVKCDGHVWEKQNNRGDNVLHSIVRFVRYFPECEERAVNMMIFLEKLMDEKTTDFKRKLFFTKNKNNMTALQLATESGHIKLFKHFIETIGVYRIVHPHDNIYEIRRFDVTEIDKVALIEAQQYPAQADKLKTDDKKGNPKEADDRRTKGGKGDFSYQSVAELLCCQSRKVATELVRADVFEEMTRLKLETYSAPFRVLFVIHCVLIVWLCVYLVVRATDTGCMLARIFLEFTNIITVISSIVYFVQEFPFRFCFAKQPFAWTALHHNVVYRVFFVLFAVFLFLDSIMYRIPDSVLVYYKTFPLVLAIIAGTWSIFFFLRICRHFSLYIVLLNEALFKTLLPFAFIILIQLLVFSTCMHATVLHSGTNNTENGDFLYYGTTLFKMGKLMVGLTEIDELLDTHENGLLVFLYVVFILITLLLMINALISVMTNQFQGSKNNNDMVWRLQKLSIIIFFEGWFGNKTLKIKFKTLEHEHTDSNAGKRFVMSNKNSRKFRKW